jgi:hypothetical protein
MLSVHDIYFKLCVILRLFNDSVSTTVLCSAGKLLCFFNREGIGMDLIVVDRVTVDLTDQCEGRIAVASDNSEVRTRCLRIVSQARC